MPSVPHTGSRDFVQRILPYLAIALLLFPSLVWIIKDRSSWTWDSILYRQHTVKLYNTLTEDPGGWPAQLISCQRMRPPLLIWIGQLFIPLGLWMGHVESGLLLFILIMNFACLAIIFKVMRDMVGGMWTPLLCCFLLVSSPFFFMNQKLFHVESLIMLLVAAFLLLMVFSNRLDRIEALLYLMILTFLGFLTKSIAVLYAIAPAAIVLSRIYKGEDMPPLQRRHYILGASALVLLAFVFLWYFSNFREFIDYHNWSYLSETWGPKSHPLEKAFFWLKWLIECTSFRSLHNIQYVLYAVGLYLTVRGGKVKTYLPAILWVAQIIIVIVFLSFSTNNSAKFVLPLLLYFAVFTCWVLRYSGYKWLYVLVALMAAYQYSYLNLVSFGILEEGGDTLLRIQVVDPYGERAKEWDSFFNRLCRASDDKQKKVLTQGIVHHQLIYRELKNPDKTREDCIYYYVGSELDRQDLIKNGGGRNITIIQEYTFHPGEINRTYVFIESPEATFILENLQD